VSWRIPTGAPYVSSLVLYDGLLYMATEKGIASAIDPATGGRVWRKRLGGVFAASPVAGDGKVYLTAESGDIFVLRAGPEGETLAQNPLGERTLASPAISNGHIFIRTDQHLIRIGP
jgi:outer membrane protein assembly factor BamB